MRPRTLPLAIALILPAGLAAQQPAPTPADTAGVIELGQAEVPPEMKNLAEVQRVLMQFYPPALRDAGVAGRATVRFVLTARGTAVVPRVVGSAGHSELDSAAVRVVEAMRFEPAKRGGAPVPVWATLPVSFVAAPPEAAPPADAASAGATPDTLHVYEEGAVEILPVLQNRNEVAREISRNYPREPMHRGRGGTASVELVVGRDGNVSNVRAVRSSERAFGAAAVRVVEKMVFSPARIGGRAVSVRLVLPVTFSLQVETSGPTPEQPRAPIGRPGDPPVTP